MASAQIVASLLLTGVLMMRANILQSNAKLVGMLHAMKAAKIL